LDPELKSCPFCGGKAVFQEHPGSYGYYSPSVWVACGNEPFDNPFRKGYDDRKKKCFAKTSRVKTEIYETGKGYRDIYHEAKAEAAVLWNTRGSLKQFVADMLVK